MHWYLKPVSEPGRLPSALPGPEVNAAKGAGITVRFFALLLEDISKKYYAASGPVGAAPRHPPEGVGEPLRL